MRVIRELRVLDVGGREPPHNLDVECALLGHLLSMPRAFDDLEDLSTADWYSDANRRIHEAAIDLRRTGQPVDLQTVGAWLKDREQIQAIGGVAYLSRLIDATPAIAHPEAYAKIVRDKARVRRLLEACQRIIGEAYEDSADVAAFANRAAETIQAAASQPSDGELVLAYDAVVRRIAQLDEQWQGTRSRFGLSTGFTELDEMTGGLRYGSLSVAAALTGGGKSAFALQVAMKAATQVHNGERIGVLYVSLEMPAEEVVDRGLCMLAGVSDDDLQSGALDDDARARLAEARDTLQSLPLWFYDAPASVAAVRSIVRRAQRDFVRNAADPSQPRRIGLVVVDYLGLMERSEDAERNDIAIGQLTRGMKLLAMELETHVLVLSQFSREAPRRGDGRPQLWDLKDSSSIEHDANLVMFLHRPWLTLQDKSTEQARTLRDCAEFIVAKNRKGKCGVIPMRWVGERFSFEPAHAGDVQRWDAAMPKQRTRRPR